MSVDREHVRKHASRVDPDDILGLLAELEQAEKERDEAVFWNERVRVCAEHTRDVAAPVGDCLTCTVEGLRARLAAVPALMDAAIEALDWLSPVPRAPLAAALRKYEQAQG